MNLIDFFKIWQIQGIQGLSCVHHQEIYEAKDLDHKTPYKI